MSHIQFETFELDGDNKYSGSVMCDLYGSYREMKALRIDGKIVVSGFYARKLVPLQQRTRIARLVCSRRFETILFDLYFDPAKIAGFRPQDYHIYYLNGLRNNLG